MRGAGTLAPLLLLGALACGPAEEAPEPAPPGPAPPAAPAPETPAAAPAGSAGSGDVARGEKLYATYCASCHGPRGAGDGPVAASLDPRPAKHSDAAYMDTLSDEHLFEVIKHGGPAVGKSPLMAPWGGTLSDAQIWDLVAFTRSLSD